MKNRLLISQGKLLSKLIQAANLGNGSTWPGHMALKSNPNFIKEILKKSHIKVVFIVGTNGKTTTTTLINHILKTNQKKVIQNVSGANLLNGIASSLLLNSTITGKVNAEIALFEIDENAFPLACKEITPDAIVMLNLFRDQLDRYGEVNTIALKWQEVLSKLPGSVRLFLNADDPLIAYLGKNAHQNVIYFGIDAEDKKQSSIDHASDSTYCPNCGKKLVFSKRYYSHLGIWKCPACKFSHPKDTITTSPLYPLDGLYNKYNINAAALVAKAYGVTDMGIKTSLESFSPAFGRQEKISVDGKNVQIILAKNPAGFSQALRTVTDQNSQNLLLVLNDNIADGTDVSWIWDIDMEWLKGISTNITITGSRVFDMALRVKYADINYSQVTIETDLQKAISSALTKTKKSETLSILPTYTAMLEVRKIITGKKIL